MVLSAIKEAPNESSIFFCIKKSSEKGGEGGEFTYGLCGRAGGPGRFNLGKSTCTSSADVDLPTSSAVR